MVVLVEGLNVRVKNLRDSPEFLEQIAAWHETQWPEERLQQRIDQLKTHVDSATVPVTLVAMLDGEPVGSVSLVKYKKLGGFPASVWMANLFVVPNYRCKGVGAVLIARAEGEAKRQALKQLYLYTNDQQNYYKKLGWSSLKHHQFSGRPITIMERSLVELE